MGLTPEGIEARRVLDWLWRALVGAGLFALLMVGAAFYGLHSMKFDVKSRTHLKPIAMSAHVCPAVEAIHVAATRLQGDYEQSFVNLDDARVVAHLRHEADELTWIIATHRSAFPQPVRAELDGVLTSLQQAGRDVGRPAGNERIATVM
jgi:hypothetical protein